MTDLTIKDVNSAIINQEWTDEQLLSMWDAVKYARSRLGRKTVWSLTLGADVKFTNSRNGLTMRGKVKKINRKNVIVQVGTTNWNVPASMLSAA